MLPAYDEIRIAGTLPPGALCDFEGLRASVRTVQTVLYGPLEDNAALRSLFGRLEIMGAELLAVRRLRADGRPAEGS